MNQQKLRFPIGAVLLLVVTFFNVINLITTLGADVSNAYISYGFMTYALMVLEILSFAFLAITLLMKMRGMITTAAAGFAALVQVVMLLTNLINNLSYGTNFMITVLDILLGLFWVGCMAVLALLTTEYVPALKKMWFLPAVLVVLAKLIQAIQPLFYISLYGYPVVTAIGQFIGALIGGILPAAAIFLIGQWLVNPYPKQVQVPYRAPAQQPQGYQPNPYQPQQGGYHPNSYQQPQGNPYQAQPNAYQPNPYQQPQQMNPAAAQELARYQQMLSAGTITQEEYNAMAGRIMGQ